MKYQSFSQNEIDLLKSVNNNEPLPILQTTNSDEEIFLRQVCATVDPKDPLLKDLVQRLYSTVRFGERKGVGIAAPQIGFGKRVFLVKRFDKTDKPFEFFINPEIIWCSDILQLGEEGCLSIADQNAEVYRSLIIQISYFDFQGNQYHEIVEGFTAVIMQHEMDHLQGILFTDRVKMVENLKFTPAQDQQPLYYPIEDNL